MKKNILNKGIKFITNPDYRFDIMAGFGTFNTMPDREYLEKIFKAVMGYPLNLDNPQTFNEKIQWLKLYDRKPEYTMMVDKYKVRDYIAEQLGEEYLIPLLGVWDDPDEIDFETLPNQFVLKCNHNSGLGMCICKDKSKLDIKKVKRELRKGLEQDYYLTGREWPYKDVPRKIICEKYMVDHSQVELKDYKVHNFNGIPKVILVCSERFSDTGLHEDFYDVDWKKLDIKRPEYPTSEKTENSPKELEKMLSFSEKLSKDYTFMRTDFYEVNGKLYFGEITLYPASGLNQFEPEKWDFTLGEWIKLPEICGGGYAVKCGNLYLWVHEQEDTKEKVKKAQKGLNDYKFMCFNGKVLCSFVCSDRFSSDGMKVTFFDRDWNELSFERHYPKSQTPIPKPLNYDKMIAFSEKLSQGIPFVRTDFYEINQKLYFGELTFFPGSGFEEFTPESADRELGSWLKLPENIGGGYLLNSEEFCLWIHEQNLDLPREETVSEELTDYKFFCFDGYVDCVMVCTDRQSGNPKFYFFDKDWKLLRYNIRGKEAPENFTLPKPDCMNEMFQIAGRLSRDKPFTRIDLYNCNGKIYFGEITFFPDSGLDKNLLPETDEYWGKMIKLDGGKVK